MPLLYLEPGPFSKDPAQLHRDDEVLERLGRCRVVPAQASLLSGHARLAFMGSNEGALPTAEGLLLAGACSGRVAGPAGTLQRFC